MALSTSTTTIMIFSVILLLLLLPKSYSSPLVINRKPSIPQSDIDYLEFPLNLEYLEAEFFLWGSLGYGLDKVDPNLTMGGPPPIGVKQAKLDPLTRDVMVQFAYQEVGHLRLVHPFLNSKESLSCNKRKLRKKFILTLSLSFQGYKKYSDRISKATVESKCSIICYCNESCNRKGVSATI